MEDEQSEGDAQMMDKECFVGVSKNRSQGGFGARLDEAKPKAGFTKEAYSILEKVAAFDGRDRITER